MAFTIIPESDLGRETLDITTGRRCSQQREDPIAGQETVHAKDQRSSTTEVRVRPGAASDRPKLRHGAGNRKR